MLEHIDYQMKSYENFWSGKHMEILKEQEGDTVLRLLTPSSGWFLDAGCGYGRFYSRYRTLYKHKVMVDYTLENLKRFKEHYQETGTFFVAADACSLPFRAGVFSTILGVRLIQNIPDANMLLASLVKVLTPHGQLLLSYFNRRNLLRIPKFGLKCFHVVHHREHKASFGEMYATHPRLFSRLVKQNGLRKKKLLGAGFTYQISNNSKLMQKLIEKNSLFRTLYRLVGRFIDTVLGPMTLSLWQFADLEKISPLPVMDNEFDSGKLADILQCPECGSIDLDETPSSFVCRYCKRVYPIREGIYDFRITE